MTEEQDRFLTAIYLDRRKSLLEFAESKLHNHALAEEAVQQAFDISHNTVDFLPSQRRNFCKMPYFHHPI